MRLMHSQMISLLKTPENTKRIKDGKSKAVEKEDKNNIKPLLVAIHKVQLDALQLPPPRKSNSKSSEVTIYVFPQKSTYTTKQNFHHHRILVGN